MSGRFAAVIGVLLAAAFGSQASAAESVYTTLDFDNGSCLSSDATPTAEDEEMGVVALVCPGYGNYPVQFQSNDERQSVHYGDPGTATGNVAFETFAPFNSIVDTVEWRLDHGLPFAAIQRFMVSTGEDQPAPGTTDGPVKGEVLVVSKVGQPVQAAGCVIGLVDALANAQADAMARQVADTLATIFRCGEDRPVYHGKRGDKAAEFEVHNAG